MRGAVVRRQVAVCLAVAMLVGVLPAGASQAEAATSPVATLVARLVQTIDAKDFGASRPRGLTYDAGSHEFLVAGAGVDGVPVHRIDPLWETIGTVSLPEIADPSTLSFRSEDDILTWVDDGRVLGVPGNVLRTRRSVPRSEVVPVEDTEASDSVDATIESVDGDPGSLATLHPSDGLVYVLDPEGDRLTATDPEGDLVASYDTSSVDFSSPEAMTFAPSSDGTDDPETYNLFVADSGDTTWDGGVTEVTLEQTEVSTTAETVDATLVQEIATSAWSPPSSDPSGIVWNPSVDQLITVDSEINETSLFEDVNMWHIDRSGSVLATGATWGPQSADSYSDEPTGLGYDDATGTLFVSDDTGTRTVNVVEPGSDGALGTTDDQVTQIDMGAHGATDTEDPEFDPGSGHLFVLGGTDREIWRIDPVDGIFGNGNDTVTSIDISHLGPTDFEGLTSSTSRGTLFVGSRNTDQIFEISHDAQLVRTINVDVGNDFVSGLAMAPNSADPSVMSLWIVDRKADEVNDGKIYEVSVPDLDDPVGNLPPVVDAGPDQTIEYPESVTLDGSVTDDGRPEDGELTHVWSMLEGPGVVTFADDSALSTTAEFSEPGVYTLELSASDGELTASDSLIVTVQSPPNSPPEIDPIEDVVVLEGDTVVVPVSASDPDGDDLTFTTDGLPAFASFDAAAQEITISPETGDAGLYGPVTVTVSDGDPDGGQAPVFRSSASAALTGASGSVLTIARPDGVDAGDLLVAQIRYRDTGGPPNLTAPPGWTEIGTIAESRANHTVLYKFAGTSEPEEYSFDQDADGGRMSGGIGAYVGVDPDQPVDSWAASASETTTLVAPSVDTTVDGTTVVRMWGWRGVTAEDVGFNVPPAGVTERWSEQVGHQNDDRNRVLAGDHTQDVAGSTGTATASGSTSTEENRRNAFTVALAPATSGLTDSTSFDITVSEPPVENSAPVAADDSASTAKGVPVDIDVLANDSDEDGDSLSVVDITQPSNGSVVVNADETVTYTPDTGFVGDDSFTYRASDGTDSSGVATVSVTVTNTAPVAGDDSASTVVDSPVTVDVLANDSDEDGDSLSVVDVTQPSNGSVVVNADETVTYTPDAGFTGSDSFTYRASDGTDVSDPATVTVTVEDANVAPVAADDSASTSKDVPVEIDVLANDSDEDGDVLSVVDVTQPSNGSVVVNADETVTYTPDAGFAGSDSFTYRASDGIDSSDPATVSVTVTNTAPVAADDSASTPKDVAVDIDVLANDSDEDGDVLSVVDVSEPSNGSVTVNADESVTYTPDAGFSGTDSFTYRASDGTDSSEPATVSVTVTNTAPVAGDDSASTVVDSPVTVDVLSNDSDEDGDSLSVVDITQPSNGSVVVNADETVTYAPDAGFVGDDSFTYRASDGTDVSNVATVTVTVSDEVLEQFALTSDTSIGSSSGDLVDTQTSDDTYQQLTEEHTGGPPPSRLSRLESQWTFEVERGDTVSFVLEARRSSNTEGDDFEFSYSADGGSTFQPLVLVDGTSDTLYEADLPETISGTVIVKVVDTDRTQGNGSTDSLFVDYMAIRTSNPQDPLPEVTVEATVDTASEDGDLGEFTISRSDTVGTLTVGYELSGSATSGVDYEEPSGSVALADGEASIIVPVVPIDDDLEEGSESVILTLTSGADYQVGSPSSATVSITDNDLIATDDYAVSESTTHGSVVSGDLTSTYTDDDVYETIREASHAGGQISRLEHHWTFSVTGGSSVTFLLQAHHTGTEDFMFSYSTDGSSWSDMVQVSKTADDGSYQEYTLPSGVSGTVHVRVVDVDRTRGEPILDSINIDDMFFRSEP